MRIHLIHLRTRGRAGVLAALGALVATGSALGAITGEPVKSATYSGLIHRSTTVTIPISFKVSKSGNYVSDFDMNYPVYCQGGGFPVMRDASAAITSKDTFSAKLPLVDIFVKPHKPAGNVTVTGKFGKSGNESGQVITNLKNAKSCNGKSPYSTHS